MTFLLLRAKLGSLACYSVRTKALLALLKHTTMLEGLFFVTQNANILSFNEVKARGASAPRTVSSTGASHARHASQGYRSSQRSQLHTSQSFQMGSSFSQGSYSGQSRSSRFALDDYTSGITDGYQRPSNFRGTSASFSNQRNTMRSSTRFAESKQTSRRTSRTQEASHQAQQQSSRATHHGSQRNRHNSPAAHQEKEGLFRGMQKRFRSAKAERDFDRTIGARERRAQADAEKAQSSRAAVYEMHMGATHRKSARMQNNEDKKNGFGGFGFSLPFNLSAGSLSAAATRGIVALAVVVFAVFMLYPSCQNYYNETRQLQQLQAEYQAINDYNTQMQSQIDYLNTDEGLEEYARSELGWIRQDEHMATVEGVESSVEGSTQSSTTHSPLNENIPAPDTWYSGVLDVLFGYGK